MTDSKEIQEEGTESTEEVELTDEQKQALAWMTYVSNEVNILLEMFLPVSKNASVGVLYKRAVTAVHESGPEYDPNKADGVEVRILFDFANVMEIPKPTPEEE
jgi:hypothetical protein